jgi:hypothetical protein
MCVCGIKSFNFIIERIFFVFFGTKFKNAVFNHLTTLSKLASKKESGNLSKVSINFKQSKLT